MKILFLKLLNAVLLAAFVVVLTGCPPGSDVDPVDSACQPTMTSDAAITYSGIYSADIRTLLGNVKPWRTASCFEGTDGLLPVRYSDGFCIRDKQVDFAIQVSWVVENYWRFGKKTEAEYYAGKVREALNNADDLCSKNFVPTTCVNCECSTAKIWLCTPGAVTTPPNNANSSVAFKNNVFTPVTVTHNGVTKVVQPGGTVSFEDTPGVVGAFHAETSGKTSGGEQIGMLVPWDYTYTFPANGTATLPLNLAPQSFFLYVVNESVRKTNKVYVNYGLQSQTVDYLTIPNDKVKYGIGYYRAFSNTNFRIEGESNWIWTWSSPNDFKLPFTENQSYTFTIR